MSNKPLMLILFPLKNVNKMLINKTNYLELSLGCNKSPEVGPKFCYFYGPDFNTLGTHKFLSCLEIPKQLHGEIVF